MHDLTSVVQEDGLLTLLPASYAQLPASFFTRTEPTPVAAPGLIRFNSALGSELGLNAGAIGEDDLAKLFSGNVLPQGAVPIAMGYAGHQFGSFVPQLGDGRAILLGEAADRSGKRFDVQLKGAGRTRYSRGGDGRAALGPVLREYLVSEAMHALGIPTTRALAAVTTGEVVQREELLPGAILTRVAASHVRVGTFEFIAGQGDVDAVRKLAGHVINRNHPSASSDPQPYLALLRSVMERQALLIARWMCVGFIHGVMNTDNMALSGETIDFGPCAFMDNFDPATVYSAIDRVGRYAYANQPSIAQWNLARFAETLLPLLDSDADKSVELAEETLSVFATRYQEHWLSGMRAKLGLLTAEEGDSRLIGNLLEAMLEQQADFTLTFRRLCDAAESTGSDSGVRTLFAAPDAFDAWSVSWRARLAIEPVSPAARAKAMRQVNPLFIPRNHLVERALTAAVDNGDFSRFEELLAVLASPYETQPGSEACALPPEPAERVFRTYCGT